MSTAQLSPGTVVDGKLTIVAPGPNRAGAHSYSATDSGGQPVALTVYDPSCFPTAMVMERSLRELRQLKNVSSPHVATVHDCGKLSDGGVFEVTAPLAGQPLAEALRSGPIAPAHAATLIEQVGNGLLEAQKVGVIHRNLGPRVIYVTGDHAVVTGFAVGEPHADASRGPLDTIAPEQIEGKVVDQRTLIYNLAALMHMLLTGAPLFGGEPEAQLQQHLTADPPDGVHARLKRALGKDPRMRPMMLKQFINDLRAIGGSGPRAPAVPSVGGPSRTASGTPKGRGWTMFMKAEDSDDSAPAAAPSAPAAAPSVAPPSAAPAAAPSAAPTAAAAEGKPKTRGWTMFMEAADDDEAAAEPAKPEPTPSKPSTRGWTMFMEDDEGGAKDEAQPAKAAEPAATEPAEGKPKTRGWTMFMEADEEESGKAADAEPEPTPQPEAAEGKPKTRGWTMFMEDDEAQADAPAAAPAAKAPAAAPSTPAAPAATPPAAGSTPGSGPAKSRGWTMFMEPAGNAPAAEAPSVEPSPAAAEAPAPADTPTPAQAPVADAPVAAAAAPSGEQPAASEQPVAAAPAGPSGGPDADAPSKKRGWTMFMEKPIEDAKDKLGGVVPDTDESTAKGWTVFSPAASGDAPPEGGGVGSKKTVIGGAPSDGPAPGGSAAPEPAAAHSPSIETDRTMPAPSGRSKTIVATTEPVAKPGPRGRGQTMVATTEPQASRPQTLVTPPGSGPAARADSGPVSGPVSGPISDAVSGPVSGPLSGPLSQPVNGPISDAVSGPIATTDETAMAPTSKGISPAAIGIGIAVAAAIGVAIWFAVG